MKGPQVTPGGRADRKRTAGQKEAVFIFISLQSAIVKEGRSSLVFHLVSESSLLSLSLSTLLLFLLLCSAGAHKSRRRPLKRDHSRGSSQQPPPASLPPPALQNIPWLRRSCAGARGQASAARGPQRCRLRCGQRLPLHSPVLSSHTLLSRAVSPANA